MRAGIAFAQARGLTEMTEALTANLLDALDETGEHEQALDLASGLARAMEASGNLGDLTAVRAVQARILTLRGHPSRVADTLDWLETTSREAGQTDLILTGLGSAAIARAALAQPDHAAALIAEIDAIPSSRENPNYPALLPALVRTALATNNLQLAHQLTTGFQPDTPYYEHALATATAALSEAHNNPKEAAGAYADAAQRWETFGVVPEQAFALLGKGRCLLASGQPTDASQALLQAREIFEHLQAGPALAETDTLLQQATALSS